MMPSPNYTGCTNRSQVRPPTPRVMPLGDSITWGHGWTPGARVGYRKTLYDLLLASGCSVDFVGGEAQDTAAGPVPDYFDWNHEGHPGFRAEEIAANVYDWLVASPADVVLLMIGTNDIGLGQPPTTEDWVLILNEIDNFDPGIVVILALIPNRGAYSAATTLLNQNITALALARIALGDLILLVDMENALIYPNDLFDGVHPNTGGYNKIAAVWFAALQPLICP